ncbi:MAG: 6-phosphofructokinase [Elusimicrobia bacterium CG08_land_8_20_14_0_20_51_18]|nr:MAG: 6-phosphofructokinase [Elusimicrobia bacterium CG08_land_8_20_14_0_20_51_18]
MNIGILTGGGDCPGLNAVIRAFTKFALKRGHRVLGFRDGFKGLVENNFMRLTDREVSGIIIRGGTILGTSNIANPFSYMLPPFSPEKPADMSGEVRRIFRKNGLDCLVAIGGDGTQNMAYGLFQMGLPVIGVPKTIDNDLSKTDYTFGYDTALQIVTEAIDRLHTTAESHERAMVIETMGRYAGWIALRSAIAGGGDLVLIPEIEYRDADIVDYVKARRKKGKNFSIIVVAEGARRKGGEFTVSKKVASSTDPLRLGGISYKIADFVEKNVGMEARVVVLGHLQRGGVPTHFDRWLATGFGVKAMDLIEEKKFGYMAALHGQTFTGVSIKSAVGRLKRVDPGSFDVKMALKVGMSFGNKDVE